MEGEYITRIWDDGLNIVVDSNIQTDRWWMEFSWIRTAVDVCCQIMHLKAKSTTFMTPEQEEEFLRLINHHNGTSFSIEEVRGSVEKVGMSWFY